MVGLYDLIQLRAQLLILAVNSSESEFLLLLVQVFEICHGPLVLCAQSETHCILLIFRNDFVFVNNMVLWKRTHID